jgi:hypothetical protein
MEVVYACEMKLHEIVTHETTILLNAVPKWEAALLLRIPEALDSNLMTGVFHGIFQSLQDNARLVRQHRPHALRSTYFPVAILSVDVIY